MSFFGLDRKDSKGNCKCRYGLVGGIASFTYPAVVEITLDDALQQLVVKNVVTKKDDPIYLNYSQVCGFAEVRNLKIENNGTSSAGNALFGGLVFGVAGAIVGGMSGIAKIKNINKALVIKYHPANSTAEERDLIFEIVQASIFHKQFIEQMQAVTNATCLTQTLQQL